MPYEKRRDLEDQLINKLRRIGILHETAGLDDVLDLQIEDILERRLQTIVFRRNMANSIHQARQLIVHRHISIEGKRISSPSYLVLRGEDEKIAYSPHSPLLNSDHPLRKTLEMVVE
jgi:small subunit ribosomal protein S4